MSITSGLSRFRAFWPRENGAARLDLHAGWRQPDLLPAFVQVPAPAMCPLDLLVPVRWPLFPDGELALG